METQRVEVTDSGISGSVVAAKPVALGATRKREPSRDCHLDLLRAIAILMVVAYHVAQMSPVSRPHLIAITRFGKYGVDLFFVLSGWLIGGLYWRELKRFGDVKLQSFLPRRWIRTIPPYLAALALAWLAVRVNRHEPFDFGYLVFIQNYYRALPFFLVSWSLCIEEHFYLFLPLGLWIWTRLRIAPHWLFALLLVAAPVCRWHASQHGVADADVFGYAQTATHLRMEGLILGFWMAHFPSLSAQRWSMVKRVSAILFVPACLLLATLPLYSELMMYRIGLTVLALSLTIILVYLAERSPIWIARTRTVKWIAVTSYSVYLTHALMIHLSRMAMTKAQFLPTVAYFPVALALVALGGWMFHLGIERTSLTLRDRWVPRRAPGIGAEALRPKSQ
jgi:peptidoglycan/LPS O-acetylase OafA/YrhL